VDVVGLKSNVIHLQQEVGTNKESMAIMKNHVSNLNSWKMNSKSQNAKMTRDVEEKHQKYVEDNEKSIGIMKNHVSDLNSWKMNSKSQNAKMFKDTDNKHLNNVNETEKRLGDNFAVNIKANKDEIDRNLYNLEAYKKHNDELILSIKNNIASLDQWKNIMEPYPTKTNTNQSVIEQIAGKLRENDQNIAKIQDDISSSDNQIKSLKLTANKHDNQLSNQIEVVTFLRENMEGIEDKMVDTDHKLVSLSKYNTINFSSGNITSDK
jgi:chromosome segregation ATPase